MTTQDIVTKLAAINVGMTVTAIAKEVFPDNPHQHYQAEAHKNVLSYYAYLDSHNRKVFCQWLDNKVIG